jgi:hypothetical protein
MFSGILFLVKLIQTVSLDLRQTKAEIVAMTAPSPTDRSHEGVINDALARLFRERGGLNAVSRRCGVGLALTLS